MVKNIYGLGNQQPSSEQEKVQRLSLTGVGASAPKWGTLHHIVWHGEDIVYTLMKIREAFMPGRVRTVNSYANKYN
jgi:hypothetical protein